MTTIIGTAGDDRLTGTAERDTLAGLGGNDVLDDGGGGPDEMIGGTGDDVYIVAAIGDSLVERADEGLDTVRTILARFTLPAFVERLFYTGSGAFVGIGNAEDNVILGGADDDALDGGDGADYLVGGAGRDRLIGGAGAANTLQGGVGDDVYYVGAVGDSLVEFEGEGIDQVRTALASYRLAANVEQLVYTGVDNFGGTGNALANLIVGGAGDDILDGGDGADYLVGGAGRDRLIGGTGAANTLQGGLGDDYYYIGAVGDSVVEFAGEGVDQVRITLASYRLGANVEQLVFTGIGAFHGTGNDADNLLIGGAGDDQLDGGLGADTLAGGAGNDLLIGGSGAANTLIGGAGDDIYVTSSSGDTIVEDADGGTDTIRTVAASYALRGNVENLEFTGTGAFAGTGSALDNRIVGAAGNDTLSGLGGNDRLEGGGGDDLLLGGDGADTLIGGSGADRLEGGEGGDVLYSGLGADILVGGAGDELYYVDHADAQLVETAGGGHDRVITSLEVFTLAEYVEDVEPVYTLAPNGLEFYSNLRDVTGNASANRIMAGQNGAIMRGLDGDDVLIGSPFGPDQFFGGNGDDRFEWAQGNDRVRYAGGETGIDGFGSNSSGFTVELSRAFFTPSATTTFERGASTLPTTANSTFFHNTSNGYLYYDDDGSGPTGPVALFTYVGDLTASQFTFY